MEKFNKVTLRFGWLIYKYLLKNHSNFILNLHKKGFLALIIFTIVIMGNIYGMNHIDITEYNITTENK